MDGIRVSRNNVQVWHQLRPNSISAILVNGPKQNMVPAHFGRIELYLSRQKTGRRGRRNCGERESVKYADKVEFTVGRFLNGAAEQEGVEVH